MKRVVVSLSFFIFLCGFLFADEKQGCQEAKESSLLAYIYADTIPNENHSELLRQMRTLVKDTCLLGKYQLGDTIYYRNGQAATYWAGKENATWYYPNGKAVTYWAKKEGATWYYPNGNAATYWAYRMNASWYYPTGLAITYWAGKEDATYYLPDGNSSRDRAPDFEDENGKLDVIPFLQFVYDLE